MQVRLQVVYWRCYVVLCEKFSLEIRSTIYMLSAARSSPRHATVFCCSVNPNMYYYNGEHNMPWNTNPGKLKEGNLYPSLPHDLSVTSDLCWVFKPFWLDLAVFGGGAPYAPGAAWHGKSYAQKYSSTTTSTASIVSYCIGFIRPCALLSIFLGGIPAGYRYLFANSVSVSKSFSNYLLFLGID